VKTRHNNLHMHIGTRFLVMVQWGLPPYEDRVLLTVSSINPEGRTLPDDGGVLRGESVSLDVIQRERIIAALRGDAPPCDCYICSP
jgi:hypothetical protein